MPETSRACAGSPRPRPAQLACERSGKEGRALHFHLGHAAAMRFGLYYHFALANQYEEPAGPGHRNWWTRAIDEYKLALRRSRSAELDTALAVCISRRTHDEAIAALRIC